MNNFPVFEIKGDPRRQDLVIPTAIEKATDDEVPVDVFQAAAMAFSALTMVMRSPALGWAAIFACVVSLARRKVSTSEVGTHPVQIMMFGVMALGACYYAALESEE
ncbi:hypothetical protein H9P43_001101 [Blastocladiella emersonii ATCC 22665]|nr:hypothetical protein H9P43_001101 [Blastocladiella emersonii ATCC 22665]